ncbi:hypothetical protein MNEG_2130 [Monoraphidium neglectum]|jgi:hypothetical protein|uniref:Uncharacterized protein n=1 Tax=Monoraphidium neglectum TaxID=145388 RepID=A0A0D2MZU6_9CHLO|nr:hypothetical protein MNEG_2130 [Monoraphidium neglectum]KIZ05822.1 hypothetical protein MNEG_2130 [Monoraphidium neglectum]|eukprot:XP_013904841.1 hypothetical protein MNEG_2130 [Monoraphidium neglectum]
MSWKQAWRDMCLRRSVTWPDEHWSGPQNIDALVADCNTHAGLNQISFQPDQDQSERPNLTLHPRTSSIMFRIVWRNPDPASREAFCLTDRGGEAARFEECREGRFSLPYPRDDEPPYEVFTDPAQLWTIPRPFAGVETSG